MSEVNSKVGGDTPKKKIRILTGTRGKSLPVRFRLGSRESNDQSIFSLARDVVLQFNDKTATVQSGEIIGELDFVEGESYSLCYEPQESGEPLKKGPANEIRIYNYISKDKGDKGNPDYKVGQPDLTLQFYKGKELIETVFIKNGEYHAFNSGEL